GAMNLPCIVTDISGSNEIILQDENGIIVPIKNKKAIFDGLNTMLLDVELRNKCKFNARHLISSRYEQSQVWNSLLKEYQILEEKLK
ncbi:glycosyltransferase, partial [Flavobacterium sp.]|uniref:glycosyltransferase n=1 Tax=Flavobacterium sp. TaxID=239 RepID=UPI0037BEE105